MSPQHTPKPPGKPRNFCGCYLCTDCSSHGRNDFVYCPTHAAAPEMLVILLNLVAAYPYASNTYAPWTEARALLARIEGA